MRPSQEAALRGTPRPYVRCLSVRPSVLCSPFTRKRKNIQCSNLEDRLPTSGVTGRANLRSKDKRSRSMGVEMGRAAYRVGHWGRRFV